MYLLSEHAILVKVVLRESMLETVLFYRIPRQALLKLHVNDQLVINCNDSCQPCLMLVIV